MSKEIFIILTDTGTLFSKTIRLYTKASYNHTSISFDKELSELYSFGRKSPRNPLNAGFVRENTDNGIFKNSSCCIYKLNVEDDEYDRLRDEFERFECEGSKYRYNLIGLLGVMFNIPVNRRYHYFCSQFVATLLNTSGNYHFRKDPSLMTPEDFHYLRRAKLIYEGDFSEYNPIYNETGGDLNHRLQAEA